MSRKYPLMKTAKGRRTSVDRNSWKLERKPTVPPRYFTIKSTLISLNLSKEFRRVAATLPWLPFKSVKNISRSTISLKMSRSGMTAWSSARQRLHIRIKTSSRLLLRLFLKVSKMDFMV